MKKIIFLAILAAAVLPAFAVVKRTVQNVTVSTSTNSTVSAGIPEQGYIRRIVMSLPAGLTNFDLAIVDTDGTAMYSATITGNATLASSTSVTTNILHGSYIIKTANALRTTNTASLVVPFTITDEQ